MRWGRTTGDMLEKDQVCSPLPLSLHSACDVDVLILLSIQPSSIVSSLTSAAQYPCQIQLSLGRAIMLLIPGPYIPVPHHGVLCRRRLDDSINQVQYLPRGRDELLRRGVRPRDRGAAQFHSSVSRTICR